MGDAPVDALLLGAEDLAKGWLLALLEQAPLEAAPAIATGDLVRDGPRICEAVARALADEDDLRRLEPGGLLEPLVAGIGALAGAGSPEPTSRVVDALHAVLWSAIRAELPDADGHQVAGLAERLWLVIEFVRSGALRNASQASPRDESVYPLRAATEEATASAPRPSPVQEETSQQSQAAAPEALWIAAVEDEIARAGQLDVPLSLLLVELADAGRVSAAETAEEATATFGRFAQALRAVVRRKDILAQETESRAWIIARDTGRVGAQALASRAARAVTEARPWRGAPMTVSAGVAVLAEDGRDASSLIDAAEQAKYAAAAAGVPVIHELPPEDNGGTGPRLVS